MDIIYIRTIINNYSLFYCQLHLAKILLRYHHSKVQLKII